MVAGVVAVCVVVLLASCNSADPVARGAAPAPSGASSAASPPISVVTSTNVYGDIVRQIAGDRARVTSLISSPDADPHSFEPSAHDQLDLSRADLVVENGGGYDDFVDIMLRANDRSITVLNAVDISGRAAHAEGDLNEHVWYDLPSMAKLADRIAAALSNLDPSGADSFSTNAASFRQQLIELQDTESRIGAAHRGQGVAVTEPVPLYLLQACGLDDRTPADFSKAIEEGNDVPPLVMQRTLGLFADHEVTLLVYNQQTTSPETEKVLDAARSHGIPVVGVTETLPVDHSYLSWMAENLAAIQSALG
jgi:zinc/manganese transport system substrate-binding protein